MAAKSVGRVRTNNTAHPDRRDAGPKGFCGTSSDIAAADQAMRAHLARQTPAPTLTKKSSDPFEALGRELAQERASRE